MSNGDSGVASEVAKLKDQPIEDVLRSTARNAERLYEHCFFLTFYFPVWTITVHKSIDVNVFCKYFICISFLYIVGISLGISNISVDMSIYQFYAFLFKEGRSVVQVPFLFIL